MGILCGSGRSCYSTQAQCGAYTLRNEYHHYGLWRPKVVFTIHNAEFGLERIGAAAHHCQRFTTVSPSYAGEAHPSLSLWLSAPLMSEAFKCQRAKALWTILPSSCAM